MGKYIEMSELLYMLYISIISNDSGFKLLKAQKI
jgi:hypothetical protein